MALRLAATISAVRSSLAISAACSATVLRSSKPSAISGSKRVPSYIPAMRSICRASSAGRPLPLSDTFGTCTAPVITTGRPLVNDTGRPVPSSAPARRFRKPEPRLRRRAPTGRPASRLSWVSKWLRVRSSVPANGTNATWRFSQIGSSDSRSAGCSPQRSASAGPASAIAASGLAGSGRATAIVGRDR